MNTIEEIIKKKEKEICHTCANKKTDLCHMTINVKNEAQCVNYEKCMKNQCHGCKDEKKCFSQEIKK